MEINPNLPPGETGNKAVDLALTKLGTPYSQERRNEEGYFDCSSFTYWVYSQLGISLQYDGKNDVPFELDKMLFTYSGITTTHLKAEDPKKVSMSKVCR